MGGRASYNRKNKGNQSYQPMLTFIAETREYAGGVLHNGDKPTGESIPRHLARVPAIWQGSWIRFPRRLRPSGREPTRASTAERR